VSILLFAVLPPPVFDELFGLLGLALSLEQDCMHPKIRISAPVSLTYSIKSFLSIIASFLFLKPNIFNFCLNKSILIVVILSIQNPYHV